MRLLTSLSPQDGPVLTQHPHTQVLSTCGFLSWKTCPLLCTCHLPILQIPFGTKKPSLTLGLGSQPSALASLGGAPILEPLWCPLVWSGATEGSCCPGHPSHQRFPRTLCTELRSLGLPVGSGHRGQCEGWVSCPTPSQWVFRQMAPSSLLLYPCCLYVVPKHAAFSSSHPVFPLPQIRIQEKDNLEPRMERAAGNRRCEDARLGSS